MGFACRRIMFCKTYWRENTSAEDAMYPMFAILRVVSSIVELSRAMAEDSRQSRLSFKLN